MYKLTKGIKKKVKGKKKPTEEELEQEELRQYRLEKQREQELREQEQRQKEEQGQGEEGSEDQTEAEAEAAGAAAADTEKPKQKPPAESDEWAKFRALTSGVDSVLNTTKESLQTIKETSYFIKKKTASEQALEAENKSAAAAAAVAKTKPKWVDVDVEEESPVSETEPEPAVAPESPKTPTPEKKRDLEEVLSEVEKLERAQYFEEDVFNTEYVDAVKDINLAVIPDSPTEDGEDPFDTSAVDEVLREKPEEIRKKKLKAIALGKAVEVLSGAQQETEKSEDQQEPPSAALPKKSRRRERGVYRRKGSLDLLETADNVVSEEVRVTKSATVSPTEEAPVKKTLLDDDIEDAGNFELNLAVTPEFYKPQPVPETSESKHSTPESQNQISDIVNEFDSKVETPKVGSNEAILAADDNDLEFDSLATESLLRAKDRDEIIGDDDPFDTSAVKEVLGEEKTVDAVDFNEEEVKFEADFGETKSRPSRPPPPVIITSPEKETPDFLTSNEHHNYEHLPEPVQFSPEAAKKPENLESNEEEEVDPFDTSAADKLVGTEIKLLEKELIDSSSPSEAKQAAVADAVEDDFEFDPRAEEEKPEPDPFDTSFAGGLVLEPAAQAAELLTSTPTHDSTPVVLPPQQVTDAIPQAEVDPFDTSIADTFSNVELKVLESELLTSSEPVIVTNLEAKLDLSATSAPPRPPPPASKTEAFPVEFDETPEPRSAPLPELLTLTPEEEHAVPVELVPKRIGEEDAAEEVDPFDTSIADKFGTAEVGVLEQELLQASPAPAAKQLSDLLPNLEEELKTKVESNGVQEENKEEEEERDVFDTSYVEAVAGSSEVDGAGFTKPKSLSISESSAALLASTPEDPNPLLQPVPHTGATSDTEEIDPFDTSVAEQFGHTELRVLESELLGDVRSSQHPPARPTPPRPAPPLPTPPVQLATALPVPSADELLAVTPTTEHAPTLQPCADRPPPRPLSPVALDPFDTSIADRYGDTELRVLEQEFVGNEAASSQLKRSFSDPDFDPRGEEKVARPATPPVAAVAGGCLLNADHGPAPVGHTLTATVVSAPSTEEPEEVDPFDTSIADSLVPGKGEILALERELLHS